jgi:tripartite-type tricarboxylate transporter receptor subunit TctC
MQRVCLTLLAVTCLAIGATEARAQDRYPSKPVKIVVPYAPGGATDIVARILIEPMRQALGQPFVVENKPGANGIIAINEVLGGRADGYTLMIGNVTTNAIAPVTTPDKVPDYEKRMAAVTRLVDVPAFLVATTTNFAPKTVPELIAFAKANRGKVRYGTVGAGSYPHYDMAFFAKKAGDLDMVAIHNKNGASGVIADMLTGDTQVAFLNVASTAAQVRAGKLRPLAMVNHSRLPDYPDIATMKEVGFDGVGSIAWQGVFAPAGTPKEVLDALNKAFVAAMQSPAAQEAFKKQNFNVVPNQSVDDARSWLAGEMAAWRTITSQVKVEAAE